MLSTNSSNSTELSDLLTTKFITHSFVKNVGNGGNPASIASGSADRNLSFIEKPPL